MSGPDARADPGRAVSTGLDVLLRDPAAILRGRRFALLSNQASVNRSFRMAHELLREACGSRLSHLLSPQHGLYSERQDNMVESEHGVDPGTGLRVWSLYGETRRPTDAMLEGIDALVIDLQDVGCRVYTYIWTISYCLEECARRSIPVVLLDRPNPLGGVQAEGARLRPEARSFVGRAPVPMRHALTLGELALLVNDRLDARAELRVVPMQGWRRSMSFPETGLPWVAPSPNLPRFEGAQVYPGLVLFEGTNLSEGRGTTTPFELCGAPFLDPWRWRDAVHAIEEPPGVYLRPVRFEPCHGKHAGSTCGGLHMHVTDASRFRPYRTGVLLLVTAARLARGAFALKDPPYEYESHTMPLDCISGSPVLRELLRDPGALSPRVLDELCDAGESWWEEARPFLLYQPEPEEARHAGQEG